MIRLLDLLQGRIVVSAPTRIGSVHDARDLRIEQANHAIRVFIQSQPQGRITPAMRPEYEQLVEAYFAAVKHRDEQREDEAPPRLAA